MQSFQEFNRSQAHNCSLPNGCNLVPCRSTHTNIVAYSPRTTVGSARFRNASIGFLQFRALYGSELLGGKSGKFFYGKNGRQEDCWRETEDKNPERRRRGRKTENHVLLGMLVRFCLYGSIQIIRV